MFYLITQVGLSHALESNVWLERRDNRLKVASLPAALPELPARSSLLKKAGPLSLPVGRVSLRDYHAGTGNAPHVIIVQDVHMNAEAQTHIAEALESLVGQYPGLLVAVEGARGAFDFTRFRSFPDRVAVRAVADYLLQNDFIGAPSYVGMTTSGPARVVGVDDTDLYKKHVEAYLASAEVLPALKQSWEAEERRLVSEKSRVYGESLSDFDHLQRQYRSGHQPITGYLQALTKSHHAVSPQIRLFIQAATLENDLDFRRIEQERQILLEQLAPRLTEAESRELLAQSATFGRGQAGHVDAYDYLKKLMARKEISVGAYRHFETYLRYIALSDQINADRLLVELEQLETKTAHALTKTKSERELFRKSERHYLTGKLLDYSLTPREWERWIGMGGRSEADAFYRLADLRSHAMAINLLDEMKSSRAHTAVLVAGGFHLDVLINELKRRGIAYSAVQPKLTKVDSGSGTSYLTAFTRQKTPLEKLVRGERLFLVNDKTLLGHEVAPAANVLALTPLAMVASQIPAASGVTRELRSSGVTRLSFAEEKISFGASLGRVPVGGALEQHAIPGIGDISIFREDNVRPVLEEVLRYLSFVLFNDPFVALTIFPFVHAALHIPGDIPEVGWGRSLLRFPARLGFSFVFGLFYIGGRQVGTQLGIDANMAGLLVSTIVHLFSNSWLFEFVTRELKWKWLRMTVESGDGALQRSLLDWLNQEMADVRRYTAAAWKYLALPIPRLPEIVHASDPNSPALSLEQGDGKFNFLVVNPKRMTDMRSFQLEWDYILTSLLASHFKGLYDNEEMNSGHIESAERALSFPARDFQNIVQGRRVLDLGTGWGVVAIAASMGNARAVMGLDYHESHLSLARLNEHNFTGNRRIDWTRGILTDLPVKSEGVDVVLARKVFSFSSPMLRRRALQEIMRALAPGGVLVIRDHLVAGLSWSSDQWRRELDLVGFQNDIHEDKDGLNDSIRIFATKMAGGQVSAPSHPLGDEIKKMLRVTLYPTSSDNLERESRPRIKIHPTYTVKEHIAKLVRAQIDPPIVRDSEPPITTHRNNDWLIPTYVLPNWAMAFLEGLYRPVWGLYLPQLDPSQIVYRLKRIDAIPFQPRIRDMLMQALMQQGISLNADLYASRKEMDDTAMHERVHHFLDFEGAQIYFDELYRLEHESEALAARFKYVRDSKYYADDRVAEEVLVRLIVECRPDGPLSIRKLMRVLRKSHLDFEGLILGAQIHSQPSGNHVQDLMGMAGNNRRLLAHEALLPYRLLGPKASVAHIRRMNRPVVNFLNQWRPMSLSVERALKLVQDGEAEVLVTDEGHSVLVPSGRPLGILEAHAGQEDTFEATFDAWSGGQSSRPAQDSSYNDPNAPKDLEAAVQRELQKLDNLGKVPLHHATDTKWTTHEQSRGAAERTLAMLRLQQDRYEEALTHCVRAAICKSAPVPMISNGDAAVVNALNATILKARREARSGRHKNGLKMLSSAFTETNDPYIRISLLHARAIVYLDWALRQNHHTAVSITSATDAVEAIDRLRAENNPENVLADDGEGAAANSQKSEVWLRMERIRLIRLLAHAHAHAGDLEKAMDTLSEDRGLSTVDENDEVSPLLTAILISLWQNHHAMDPVDYRSLIKTLHLSGVTRTNAVVMSKALELARSRSHGAGDDALPLAARLREQYDRLLKLPNRNSIAYVANASSNQARHSVLVTLCHLYLAMGRPLDALALVNRQLVVPRKELNSDPDVLAVRREAHDMVRNQVKLLVEEGNAHRRKLDSTDSLEEKISLLSKAEQAYKQAVALAPNHPETLHSRFLLGRVYARWGEIDPAKFDDSVAVMEEGLALCRRLESLPTVMFEIDIQRNQGFFTVGLAQTYKKNGNNREIISLLGEPGTHSLQHRYRRDGYARFIYSEALFFHGNDPDRMDVIIDLLANDEGLLRSDIVERAVGSKILGHAYAARGMPEKALALFSADGRNLRDELKPSRMNIGLLATFQLQAGRHDDAIASLNAHRDHESHVHALVLARAHFELGVSRNNSAYLEETIRLLHDDQGRMKAIVSDKPGAYHLVANAQLMLGRPGPAAKTLENSAGTGLRKLLADNVAAHVLLSHAYRDQGRVSDAIRILNLARSRWPTNRNLTKHDEDLYRYYAGPATHEESPIDAPTWKEDREDGFLNSLAYYRAKLNGRTEEEARSAGVRGMMVEMAGLVASAVATAYFIEPGVAPVTTGIIIVVLAYLHALTRAALYGKLNGRAPPVWYFPVVMLAHATVFLPYLLFSFILLIPFAPTALSAYAGGALIPLIWHAGWDSALITGNTPRGAAGRVADAALRNYAAQPLSLGLRTFTFEQVRSGEHLVAYEAPTERPHFVVVPDGTSFSEILAEIGLRSRSQENNDIYSESNVTVLLTGDREVHRERLGELGIRAIRQSELEQSVNIEQQIESLLLVPAREGRSVTFVVASGAELSASVISALQTLSAQAPYDKRVFLLILQSLIRGGQGTMGRLSDLKQLMAYLTHA